MRHVYMLINHVTEMVYIGSANDVKKRIDDHVRAAYAGSDNIDGQSSRLYEDIVTCGPDMFEVVVISSHAADEAAFDAETFWISYTDSWQQAIGYNVQRTAKRKMQPMARPTELSRARQSAYGLLAKTIDTTRHESLRTAIKSAQTIGEIDEALSAADLRRPMKKKRVTCLEDCTSIHHAYATLLKPIKDPSERAIMKLRVEEHFRSLPSQD